MSIDPTSGVDSALPSTLFQPPQDRWPWASVGSPGCWLRRRPSLFLPSLCVRMGSKRASARVLGMLCGDWF